MNFTPFLAPRRVLMDASPLTDDHDGGNGNVRWLRPQVPRDLPIRVTLRTIDSEDGPDEEVRAVAMRQDNGQTQFVDASGTVVAAWDSATIEQITWPDGVTLAPGFRGGGAVPRSDWPDRLRKLRQKRPKAYMRWEVDEDERLATEVRAGRTIHEMAELHGRGESAVLNRLLKLSLVTVDGAPAEES